jgi:hypothetical protein
VFIPPLKEGVLHRGNDKNMFNVSAVISKKYELKLNYFF